MDIIKIKSLCDYLLGYWENEVEDNEITFNKYFITKYGVDIENEFRIDIYSNWKGAYIELNNLLCILDKNNVDENNSELCKLLMRMVFISSYRNNENMNRMNILLKNLYDRF
jgi:hypothetical protein